MNKYREEIVNIKNEHKKETENHFKDIGKLKEDQRKEIFKYQEDIDRLKIEVD